MKLISRYCLHLFVLTVLAVCTAVLAQNTASSTQQGTASATNNSSASATASPTASGNSTMNGNSTVSGNATGSSNMTTSTTPTTFPIASVPSTGYLAGTAAAPAPGGGSGASGSVAQGPDDSHIVSASLMLKSTVAAWGASVLALGVGVWVLL